MQIQARRGKGSFGIRRARMELLFHSKQDENNGDRRIPIFHSD